MSDREEPGLSAACGTIGMSEAARSWSSERPLTHLIDLTDRQDEMNATCSIDGCDRDLFRRELCQGHYLRLIRTGSVGTVEIRVRNPEPPPCKQDGCDRSTVGGGRGWCGTHYKCWVAHGESGNHPVKSPGIRVVCKMPDCEEYTHRGGRGYCPRHYVRVRKYGDPTVVNVPANPPALKGPDNVGWKGDSAGYGAVHRRLAVRRGRASDHSCEHCGEKARHWAYDHSDPDEKTSDKGHPYSTDPDRYIPLCARCHYRFDSEAES